MPAPHDDGTGYHVTRAILPHNPAGGGDPRQPFARSGERDFAIGGGAPGARSAWPAQPRDSRGASPAERMGAAIEGAIHHRLDPGIPLTAEAREFRGMTLVEMARELLTAQGRQTRGLSRAELAMSALSVQPALQIRSGGAMSTSDFPSILANVASKLLRRAYEAAPQTFRPIVRVASVADFKQVSRTQLSEAPRLDKVNEHGEFKRGRMSDAAERFRLETFGKIVPITRQAIINDDLDAFSTLGRAFGIAAANLESDLVWGIITANAAMADGSPLFHANHKNLGAGSAIAAASVGAGRQAMRQQTGIDGATLLNIQPAFIVGPTGLQTVIEQLLTQLTPASTGNVVPEAMQRLAPITEPRLDTASASAWYLAADPAQVDVIELAYLEGQDGLYTETRVGFDTDAIEVKARLDVAAKAIDWRGLWKNPGV